MNALTDDQVFPADDSGIIGIPAATGISGRGAYKSGVSSAVELLEPGVPLPDQLSGLVFNNSSIQLIIKSIQEAVNKGSSMSVPVDFLALFVL